MTVTGKPKPGEAEVAGLSPEQMGQFAGLVAENLFKDYRLSLEEMATASEVLWPASGGAEYAKILHYAKKAVRSERFASSDWLWGTRVHDAMYYHLSNAEWERMALRTGASLMVNGQTELGRRIVEMTAEGNWRPPPVEKGTFPLYFQLSMYAVMFSVMIFGTFLTGLWWLVIIGAPIALVAGVAAYLIEKPKWKVHREQREAHHYEAALDRIDRGAKPKDVFGFDGSILGRPTEKVPTYPFEVSADPAPADPQTS